MLVVDVDVIQAILGDDLGEQSNSNRDPRIDRGRVNVGVFAIQGVTAEAQRHHNVVAPLLDGSDLGRCGSCHWLGSERLSWR